MRFGMRRFLFWLTGHLPLHRITRKGEHMMERYYVGRFRGKTWYIHRFLAPDPQGLYHNHSWNTGLSFCLVGGFVEASFDRKRDSMTSKSARMSSFITRYEGERFHRISYIQAPDTWTLFMHDEYVRDYEMLGAEGYEKPVSAQYHQWWKVALKGNDPNSKRAPLK